MTPKSLALTLSIPCTPRPQPRPRFVGGRVVSTASPKAKIFAQAVQRAARAAVSNLGGADAIAAAFAGHGLAVVILAEFKTTNTTRWGLPHSTRPDGDNIAKAVLDNLMAAGALGGDDSRVVDLQIVKRWAERGRLSVTVQPATRPKRSNTTLQAPPAWLRR